MKVVSVKINHLVQPLGIQMKYASISYLVTETQAATQQWARVEISTNEDFTALFYDSGERADIHSTGFRLPIELAPMTRYYVRVTVQADNGETACSSPTWFETSKVDSWKAEWITPDLPKDTQAAVYCEFETKKAMRSARLYALGLGVYEVYLNGHKLGDECLLPGLHAYDKWLQFQTFIAEPQMGKNRLTLVLGDGWYKGIFGLKVKRENYGNRLACIAELHLWYEDGTHEVISTDSVHWHAQKSKIIASSIYNGEVYDATLDTSEEFAVKTISLDKRILVPRLSPPLRVQQRVSPVKVLYTPAGETVLDMGQNMVGWLEFVTSAPQGTKLHFQFGETLQDGNFYRDNLRDAKAEFVYISDGTFRRVRQYFTYYGFRYVKIMGWIGEVKTDDFTGLVIHSDMERRGFIETSDPLINKLFENAWWGQRGNFLDTPTDCPQRDERLGWTGDAQVFSGTAMFNADAAAFYSKFGHDLALEQNALDGAVPDTVPVVNRIGTFSTAWGEAATIIPWNVYLHTGDPAILEQQFDSMRAWVDYMKAQDDAHGGKRLWQSGFHYGDWLALDGRVKNGVYGATDPFFISSAYYFYSTKIVAKAATILGLEQEATAYRKLAEDIKEAFRQEYFTPAGRLCVDTMTAYVVVLYMGLVPDGKENVARKGLLETLKRNRYHLNTGFVGTPFLCRVLSENGMNDIAYRLLLEKGYPGWLYEVLMGATTVWERWDSILPDGKISGTGMNSLNHYSYGSIVEWMYREMVGINPCEEAPGFHRAIIAPKPNYRITWVKGSLVSASGKYECAWQIEQEHLRFTVTVPFNASAVLYLPDADLADIGMMAAAQKGSDDCQQCGNCVRVELKAGTYHFAYHPTAPYRKIYSRNSLLTDLEQSKAATAVLQREYYKDVEDFAFSDEMNTLDEMMNGPFTAVPYEQQERIDKLLFNVQD